MADPTRDGATRDGERLDGEPLGPDGRAPVARDTNRPLGRPPLPATVRIASRGRAPAVVTTVMVVFLFGALWKPWAPPPGSRPLVQGPIPTASPIPSTLPIDELAELRRECDEPGGWRVYSREGFLDRIVRVWRSVEPAPAPAGPLDPAIPLVQAGPANEALGYCAPWSGPERPPADSVVTAWQVALGAGRPGSPAPDSAIPVRLIRILPARASVLGAVYEGPGGKPGALDGRTGGGWTVGRYVFAIRATGWERWWSVEISGPGPNRPGASSAP